jgi:hypothetical protein
MSEQVDDFFQYKTEIENMFFVSLILYYKMKHTEVSVAMNGTQQRLVKSASKDDGGEISND